MVTKRCWGANLGCKEGGFERRPAVAYEAFARGSMVMSEEFFYVDVFCFCILQIDGSEIRLYNHLSYEKQGTLVV